MARGESLYQIDFDALRGIEPDLIITQDLCRVCAASPGDLADALTKLQPAPRVLSLNPSRLTDVWNDIRAVGEAAGCSHEASSLVERLERRVAAAERAVRAAPSRPRILCLEWLDPPFVGGHWVPEMVERAGGIDVLGRASQPGFRVEWDQVLEAQPEVIVAMPCGYDLKGTIEDFKVTPLPAAWRRLPAVRAGRLYAVDGSAYFSRPGPRLAAGVEILAHALHPTLAPVGPPAKAIARLG
jgi:iron complex transport system substrate-binding protein